MRHTVDLNLDEVGPAIAATARLLDTAPIRLTELSVAAGPAPGRARLTAVVEAPNQRRVAELFARLARPKKAVPPRRHDAFVAPYHWQADGAGHDRG